MLAERGLKATFYIPRSSQRPTLTPEQIRQIAARFEIGAHTLDHVVLTDLPLDAARRQIVDSRKWVEDVTGQPCRMFCPPVGRFHRDHLAMAREAGFIGVRTVELLSIDWPRREEGLRVMPTTIQAHPHGFGAYARNAIKRKSAVNLWRYIRHGAPRDWGRLAAACLNEAISRGGVFHLWGHSWELDEMGQWDRLGEVLGALARVATAAANGEIAHESARIDTKGHP